MAETLELLKGFLNADGSLYNLLSFYGNGLLSFCLKIRWSNPVFRESKKPLRDLSNPGFVRTLVTVLITTNAEAPIKQDFWREQVNTILRKTIRKNYRPSQKRAYSFCVGAGLKSAAYLFHFAALGLYIEMKKRKMSLGR